MPDSGGLAHLWGMTPGSLPLCTMTSLMLPAVAFWWCLWHAIPHHGGQTQHFVDVPSESRKLHHRSVPTVGGVMLLRPLCAALVSFAISPDMSWTSFSWLGVSLPDSRVFHGLKDDIVGISANKSSSFTLSLGPSLSWAWISGSMTSTAFLG